jgi:hypothetical protein
MPHPSHTPLSNSSTNHKVFITQFSPASCCFLHLTSKYYPQYPILEHLQATLLPQHEKPIHLSSHTNKCTSIIYYLTLSRPKHSAFKCPLQPKTL